MKVDRSENLEHLQKLMQALGVSTFFEPVKWLSVVGEDGEVCLVWAYHNFGPAGCEISGAVFTKRLLPRSILRDLLSYPFHTLGLRRVTCIVRVDNAKSAEITARMGFRVEGLLRNWYPDCDGVLFGLLKEECKWIRI